jgi:glycine hydroxymethyltransferase
MNLKSTDLKVYNIINKEEKRQKECLEMIASENFVSKAILEATASLFTNKYSEGYSGKRYYGGQEFTDEIEVLAKERALKLFDLSDSKWHVNVQPYSGSPANLEVFFALLNIGDTVMGMNLSEGGHLTHGHKVNFSGKSYNFVQYGLGPDGRIDYNQIEEIAKKYKPKLIISGATAYPRIIDFKKFNKIAKSVGAVHMADISHIAGLVAGGIHPSPFSDVDVVTTTTHKTLRGPRGAIIICKKELAEKIDKAVFPGMQGGPHVNTIAAKAVAFKEAMRPEFKKYTQDILDNMQCFAKTLQSFDFDLISGGTDNHLVLVDLQNKNITGKDFEDLLGSVGIVVNKNSVPGDPKSPMVTSGIRVGVSALTSRRMTIIEMQRIAELFNKTLDNKDNKKELNEVAKEVKAMATKFPLPGIDL